MTESKLSISNRLRKDGRWEQASSWKDGKIRELRAAGIKRAEAQAVAWQAVAEKFPPIEKTEPEKPGPELDVQTDVLTSEEVKILACLAPGSGKKFSAADEVVFYDKILPKIRRNYEKAHLQESEERNELHRAIMALSEAKGFADDYLSFASYLRGLA